MEPLFEWGQVEVCQPSIATVDDVESTRNGNSLSVLLSGRQIELDGCEAPLSSAYVTSLRVPVEPPKGRELIGYRSDVRGFAATSFGACLVFIAELGGVAHTFQQAFDETTEGTFTFTVFSLVPPPGLPYHPDWPETRAPEPSEEEQVQENGGYTPVQTEYLRDEAGSFSFSINLALFATRRTHADHARMEVDSVDVEAIWR